MIRSLSDVLIESQLVKAADLRRAVAAKDRDGGSLALNLVLLGSAEPDALAVFYADHFGVPRAARGDLASASRSAFERVPLEIAYEYGLVPLGFRTAERLVVGVVDPSEVAGIDEAQFFAGLELELCVVSVVELAEVFERVAGASWKVSSAELRALGRRLGTSSDRLDRDLKGLFSQAANDGLAGDASGSVAVVENVSVHDGSVIELGSSGQHLRVELVDEPDGPVVELALSSSGESRRYRSESQSTSDSVRVLVEPVDSADDEDVVELAPMSRVLELTAARPPLARETDSADPQTVPNEASGRLQASTVASIAARTGDRPIGTTTPLSTRTVGARVVESDSPRSGIGTAGGLGQREDGRREATSPGAGVDVATSAAAVGTEFLAIDAPELLAEQATGAAAAAVELAVAALSSVTERDAVARELADSLSLVFPTVLLLSLRWPRLMVWDGVVALGDELPQKLVFEVRDGDLWQRVVDERVIFRGVLPRGDSLREALPRAMARPCMVAPMTMGGRPIALLVLAAGHGAELAPIGDEIRRLALAFEAALERVIMLRKRSSRAV